MADPVPLSRAKSDRDGSQQEMDLLPWPAQLVAQPDGNEAKEADAAEFDDQGRSALHRAASSGDADAADALLRSPGGQGLLESLDWEGCYADPCSGPLQCPRCPA